MPPFLARQNGSDKTDPMEHRDQPLPAFGDPERHFLIDPSDQEGIWAALDADGAR